MLWKLTSEFARIWRGFDLTVAVNDMVFER